MIIHWKFPGLGNALSTLFSFLLLKGGIILGAVDAIAPTVSGKSSIDTWHLHPQKELHPQFEIHNTTPDTLRKYVTQWN